MSRCTNSPLCHHDAACEDLDCPGRPENARPLTDANLPPLFRYGRIVERTKTLFRKSDVLAGRVPPAPRRAA